MVNLCKMDRTRETPCNFVCYDIKIFLAIVAEPLCVESSTRCHGDVAKTTATLIELRPSEELPSCKLEVGVTSEPIIRRNEDNEIVKCDVLLNNRETEASALAGVSSEGASRACDDTRPKILVLQDDGANLLHRTSDIDCIFDYGSSHDYDIPYSPVASPRSSSPTLVEREVENNVNEKKELSTVENKEEEENGLVYESTAVNSEEHNQSVTEEPTATECSVTENCVELAEVPYLEETFEQDRKPEEGVQLDSSNGLDSSNSSSNSSSTSDVSINGSTTSNISGSSNRSGFQQNEDDDSRLWLAADDDLIFGDRKAAFDRTLMAEEDEDNLDDRVWRSRFFHHNDLQSPRMVCF